MWTRLARVPFAFLAVAACFVWQAVAVRAELPAGAVYVTTLPSGADIWLDGTYVGRSPVLIDALPRGHHAVTITKSGWSAQEVDVDVRAATVAMSSTRLMPGPRALAGKATGAVELREVPPDETVTLDGAPLDGDPHRSMQLPAGPHRVAIVSARGRTTQTFVVYPDTTTQVVLREPPADVPPAGVVAPAGDYLPDASFVVDGSRVVVRYAGHVVVGRLGDPKAQFDGSPRTYAAAPQTIGGKLFLPLELLEKLTADPANK